MYHQTFDNLEDHMWHQQGARLLLSTLVSIQSILKKITAITEHIVLWRIYPHFNRHFSHDDIVMRLETFYTACKMLISSSLLKARPFVIVWISYYCVFLYSARIHIRENSVLYRMDSSQQGDRVGVLKRSVTPHQLKYPHLKWIPIGCLSLASGTLGVASIGVQVISH